MTQKKKGNWRDLCEAVAREMDYEKLLELTEELIKVLDEEAAVKGRLRLLDPRDRTLDQVPDSASR
jgi:hypothetical protein